MSDTVLHLERLIAAPPERVFAHWVEPALLVKWWGPEGAHIPEHAIDVRPGGAWRTTMGFSDGRRMTVSGVYRTIDAPKRLVFTWAWEDEKGERGHETEVTVEFAAVFHPIRSIARMSGVLISIVWPSASVGSMMPMFTPVMSSARQ